MKKIENQSDIQKLSEDDFTYLKRIVEQEQVRRTEPEFETIEAIYFDDGCDGWFMDVDDFQECARKKDDPNDNDLIDDIEFILYQGSDLKISKGQFTKESFYNKFFFGKENPYQDEMNKIYGNEE